MRFLWGVSPLIQLAVAAIMLRRGLHRRFPMFFSYSLFRATTTLVIFSLFMAHRLDGGLFGYATWIHEIGCILLRFAVIYEVFTVVLEPFSSWSRRADNLFRYVVMALLTIGVGLAVYHQWGPYDSRMAAGINLIDRTVNLVQSGLLLGLVLFSRYVRLSGRSFAFGIVLGMGIFATVDLGMAAVLMESSKLAVGESYVVFVTTIISMAVYMICVVIWLAYTLLPQPAPAVEIPRHDLDSWNTELQRLLQR